VNPLSRNLVLSLVVLACAPLALAQNYSLNVAQQNRLYYPFNGVGTAATAYGPPGSASLPISNTVALPATTGSNNQGMGQSGGSSRASTTTAPYYPSNTTRDLSTAAGTTLVLRSSTFGGVFASGLPRYMMGDEITVPLTRADLTTVAPAGYWRPMPVQPGEGFLTAGTVPTITIPTSTVNVTSSGTDSRLVAVASVPVALVKGASLLGQPIIDITGTTVTLADFANTNITGSVASTITPALNYYYSPHAEKCFASQPGQVSVSWVSNVASGGFYEIMTEVFAVSSTTSKPIRTIYWNQRGFDAPPVTITDPNIMAVNPVYNLFVPKAVTNEVVSPGDSPSAPPIYSTLKFTKVGATAQLSAYNVEGRVFVEYLGKARVGNTVLTYIGSDIVEIIRQADTSYTSVSLGKEILPHDGSSGELIASPVNNGSTTAYYAAVTKSNGSTSYYAERATSSANNPDNGNASSTTAYNDVKFYWLKKGDYGINWPIYKDAYWLRWSPNLTDYTFQTVDAGGSTANTGLKFTSGSLPSIVYQDDPAGAEASMDALSQSIIVNPGADGRNRSLLKFTAAGTPWYVNLYTQAETRATQLATSFRTDNNVTTVTVASTVGLEVGMFVSGTGYSGTIASILDGTRYTLNQAVAAVLPTIPNPSFEQYALDNYWYQSSQDIPGWTFVGQRGVQRSNGYVMMENSIVPDGQFAVFMQNTASATTTITGLIAGMTYEIQLSVARRNHNTTVPLPYTVSVDGSIKLSETLVYSGTSAVFSAKTVSFTATGSTASLSISTAPVGDATLLLDDLHIRSTATYTVESDQTERIAETTAATVGDRIAPPAGHELGGYISNGTCYYPAGYVDPFTQGMDAANKGAIIPVNAKTGNNTLTVRWFKKVPAPSSQFGDFYVPGKIGRYTVSFPSNPTQLVIAQGVGTGDLTGAEALGSVYYQNDSTKTGYNPNEEHAFMLGGRAYALRDDLNLTTAGATYTSEPYLLLAHSNAVDKRPAMKAYKVVRTDATYTFNYTATAGTLLVKPYPLPLLPLAMVGTGDAATAKDLEIVGADAPVNTAVQSANAYKGFTFKDRKGFTWIHRGPHATGTPSLTMKLYYKSQDGFFIPGMSSQPPVGTILPFLRNAARTGQLLTTTLIDANPAGGAGQIDEPLAITYTPAWPTAVPELAVGESLTLAKYGLPQVRGQASAQVYYQGSVAKDTTNSASAKASVMLHDPTREKTYALSASGLASLPTSISTTSYEGKTYFQGLSPSLQKRIYLDPLRGGKGSLVFKGQFHDAIAGEDYLDLNVLTAAELARLKALVPAGNNDKTSWDAALDGLTTTVETFIEDPSKLGTYKVGSTATVGGTALAEITNPDTAVDSYAVTATGKGTGYVTMVFGNGNAFTPEGDPVQLKVFKVADRLYTGDLKVVNSSNPLDEQVSLRHSGDFAAKPQEYEFDWRWTTGAAGAPAVYRSELGSKLGAAATWHIYTCPGANLPTAAQYASTPASRAATLPRSVQIRPAAKAIGTYTPTNVNGVTVNFANTSDIAPGMVVSGSSLNGLAKVVKVISNTQIELSQAPSNTTSQISVFTATYSGEDAANGYPSVVLKSSSGVDFTSGVPGDIVFSASLGIYDGMVLYVNGNAALAYNAPTTGLEQGTAGTGLSATGLSKQFKIAPSFFTAGANTLEVALYTTADVNSTSSVQFFIEAATETDMVASSGSVWQSPSDPSGVLSNTAIVGGEVTNPFGGPQFVLNDRWFTVRYRPKASAGNVLGSTNYSRWMPAQFNEGWIKRVLAGINPFSQRVTDLYNNAVNTDVSVVTQAGKRWEGDIALTMDNVDDVGLIEIYETVLNRAKGMSIDASTNDPDTNNALILAAGYLNDLYMILGNEAYSDAANPTISLDDGSVNTSRFSFEGQVASSIDEELALLRGRDDSVSPGVITAPAYNRLYWNYTGGINSGESLYATNYNIKEKSGSSTANGVIDESDAQRMFPQGHGDAYGHFLTALTGYYRLLHNSNFTWTPRAEAVTVMGQAVTIDYRDERKFAATAASLARTSQQVCELVYRKEYQDDTVGGWAHFTGGASGWALDETVSRSSQGALFNWALGNALLPAVDTIHTGVQKIDRSTVPEFGELEALATSFQTTMDNADAHLNPLGLSPGAIAFDISPDEMKAGKSHYEQVYGRALAALNNAAGSFEQAGRMTASLMRQQNTVDDYSSAISDQETAYVSQLIEIYGAPYAGDIGPGKVYAQGYAGPDLVNWFVVDRPFASTPLAITDTVSPATVAIKVPTPTAIDDFTGKSIPDIVSQSNDSTQVKVQEVTVNPNEFIQYSDVYRTGMGARSEAGELQTALMESHLAYLDLLNAVGAIEDCNRGFLREAQLLLDTIDNHSKQLATSDKINANLLLKAKVITALEATAEGTEALGEFYKENADALAESLPKVAGLSFDATSAVRGAIKLSGVMLDNALVFTSLAFNNTIRGLATEMESQQMDLDSYLVEQEYKLEAVQLAYEVEQKYREMTGMLSSLAGPAAKLQMANERVRGVLAKGMRVLAERESFRIRASAIIQGYRTKDLSFRLFRDESLEQYRSLFDLASRYSYLAVKSYDYETGLLGTSSGQRIFNRIVASRSLGDLTGGVPQATTSTLGDAGLAGTLAQVNADFSVAKGRLGINNPDQYGTVFSLRSEKFRLLNSPDTTSDDDAWQQMLEQHMLANVAGDSDVAKYCRNIAKPDGTAVPGIIIPFTSTIQHGLNFFGLDYAAGDHNYTPSNYATKIYRVGIALPGYVGMDSFAAGNPGSGAADTTSSNALGATPYVYLIPCGNDSMLAPPLGDTNTVRTWTVQDQALPLPYNLGGTDFNSSQFFKANGTLSEQPWIIRKHQAFRPVADATMFYGSVPQEFTNTRLIGRSVWNSRWKIVIPAYTLLKDEQTGLNRFAASVKDIQLFLRTYSNSGN
jgi:hypothetical protein